MEKESEVKNRLYLLAEKMELKITQFSTKIGKDRTYLSNIKNEVQTDVLRNIYNAFPDVNLIWIVTGEGEMFLSENTNTSNNESLTIHLKEEIKELSLKNELLNREIGRLESKIDEFKNVTSK